MGNQSKATQCSQRPVAPSPPKEPQSLATSISEGLAVLLVESSGGSSSPKGTHWRCEPAFLELLGLRRADVEEHVRAWWGNKELWLNMLVTEIGKGVGARLELDYVLGASWADDVDSWSRAAYSQAVEEMSSKPSRGIMSTKAAKFVREVLVKFTPGSSESFVIPPAAKAPCQKCQRLYLVCARLSSGRCGSCCSVVAADDSSSASDTPPAEDIDWRSLPPADIHGELQWKKASGMKWCHGNSGGVTLLRLPSGVACIKKFCPMELMATRLSESLGVRTARLRVLVPGCPEKRPACTALSSFRDWDDSSQARKAARAPILSVMEFADGCVMMGLPAHQLLCGKDAFSDLPGLWHALGRLAAFDILINNFDRLPLVWSNDGNLGNVMLGSRGGAVVGIDQAVHPINHVEGLENYKERVRKLVIALRGESDACLKGVQEAVFNNTAATLGQTELAAVRAGALEFLRNAAALSDLDGVLDEVCGAVFRESAFKDDPAASSAREVCEATMILDELPASVKRAREMISQVLCTVKEALSDSV